MAAGILLEQGAVVITAGGLHVIINCGEQNATSSDAALIISAKKNNESVSGIGTVFDSDIGARIDTWTPPTLRRALNNSKFPVIPSELEALLIAGSRRSRLTK